MPASHPFFPRLPSLASAVVQQYIANPAAHHIIKAELDRWSEWRVLAGHCAWLAVLLL